HHGPAEGGDGPDLLADQGGQLALQVAGVALAARLEHHEGGRELPLELVGHADHRALGHVRVPGDDLLDGPGGQPVPGHVDDVVDPAHDEQVAVLVDVAAVAGQVVAG